MKTGRALAAVFDNQTTGSEFASLFVDYRNGRFGRVDGKKEPFLEDLRLSSLPKMTLAQAVSKLGRAGHRLGFLAVTLRWPLAPGFHEPLYIFGFGHGRYWTVGTKTGKVKPIS